MELYINIVLGILAVIVTFMSYYFAIKSKIEKAAGNTINFVEDVDAIGEEKMKIAVEQIYSIVPAVVKPIFNRTFIEQITQEVFDKMAEFAKKQVNKEKK